ncbi:MAG: CDF family Co(II)/Ni(II) efflux transporter DmeF [Leptolyngbyaceae cyanobacterium bins.349]|nr:CDF family Co(II)/Ni(II) efflux transporter DmeF [Leptolyngbyaceae cyanobacterium bins.349]
MHIDTIGQWQHSHDFSGVQAQAEKNTKVVLLLTALTMGVEILAGSVFKSMALLADGWHMATHVAAFGITVFAYHYARTHANNPQYTYGTGKVSVLGGFTSAVSLAVIALLMAIESTVRLVQPQTIQFNEAIYVALIGLIVNLISAMLLQDHPHHGHDHPPSHHPSEKSEHHHHRDHNLQAAYIHVLADALTSVLAIAALLAGKYWGWVWLDAVMGGVGAVVISRWAYGLVRETGAILLDGAIDKQTRLAIARIIEHQADTQITDLHVWYLSQHHVAATISLVTTDPQPPQYYKNLLQPIPSLSHIIVEVNPCLADPAGNLHTT